jgi:hypothetical protein
MKTKKCPSFQFENSGVSVARALFASCKPDPESPEKMYRAWGNATVGQLFLVARGGSVHTGGEPSNVIELPMQQQTCDVCSLVAPQLCFALTSPTVAAERLVRPQAYPPL